MPTLPATLRTPELSQRLGSILVDHLLVSVFIAFVVATIVFPYWFGTLDTSNGYIDIPSGFFMATGTLVSLYFNKDIFHGRSIAKRIFQLQVIDLRTGLEAGPLKCFLRNLTVLIWPVEVILLLVNNGERLGDKLANTAVVVYDRTSEARPLNTPEILLSLLLGILVMSGTAAIIKLFQQLFLAAVSV